MNQPKIISLRQKKLQTVRIWGFPINSNVPDKILDEWVEEVLLAIRYFQESDHIHNLIQMITEINNGNKIVLTGFESVEDIYWCWRITKLPKKKVI